MLGGEEIVPGQWNLFLPIPLLDYDDMGEEHHPQILGFRHRDRLVRRRLPTGIATPSRDLLRGGSSGRQPGAPLWHGGDRANLNDRMSREEAAALVRYLEDQVAQG